ncbi:prolyl endopeptidase-like [Sinocyclocheilus rhinocerous]|uniref:prolyl endopeptidase-like n=1 Tax=Sinocyclocheilus rhinocerous TaxID=307959 RepID=UPI0007B79994|nr:PREDICTED: prolyl endopeptidase-like [Sinocyclocheilus rhinocerous]
MAFQYPNAHKDESVVDDYHGCKVRDPYSWLEDPDSEKTQAFVNAQNQLTLPFLEQCEIRDIFKDRMTELYDYPKYSCPFKRGNRYFHFYNTGLQNQSVLYMQKNLEAEPSVFLDPNSFSEDGTVALRGYAFSEDGEYLAYGTSASGSDWVEIRFLRVDGAVLLEDRLERVKFTCMSWTHDGKGLFYNSYPVQEGKSDVFATCTYSRFLFVCFLHDVKNVLKMFHLSSGEEIRTFPLDVGSIVGFTGRKKDSEIFYSFTSFLSPAIIYHCDLTKEPLQPHIFREVTVKGFSPADYQTTQVFYPSKDGTQIPMFIVHKKGIKLDGSHPAFLYGYGGFNISITPSYSVSRLIFVRHLGGVLAVANIRGGGEYGETWHKAAMLANKQNCFTDFQCAAEYLIKEGYTSPKKITINGGSNGGLLVAACVNQRPDLFGCAVAQVGVMDMLKFHKFTIGHAWTTDFGCSEIKAQFDWLIKYSPLHNIRVPEADGVQYPAVLLLTGDHDDRVVPLHSLKYMATLQSVIGQWPGQSNPLFIYVDTKSGHGAGKPTSKVIQEVADTYAFIARCLNLSWIE